MERMEGVDAGYLYLETPTMHMHTLKVALLEPSAALDFDVFTDQLLARLDRLPPFQRRILPVPARLNHPLWLADRDIEPGRHVFHHRLPAGAGMAELEALVGRIASTPLARDVPLWEVHVCEALADGRLAVVGKMHHAIADGAAANALLANLTDQGPAARSGTAHDAEPVPSPWRQAWLGLRDAVAQLFTLPGLLLRTGAAVVRARRRGREVAETVPRPVLDVPRVSFNGALTAERTFTTASLPLSEVKEVRHRHGVSVNDVVLGVVAGALRMWMDDRGEHPGRPLVAGVPVSTDAPGSGPRLGGNRVSNLFTSLATDLDDPHARLHQISRTTTASKVVQQTLGPRMLIDWVQFAPPAPLSGFMRLYSRTRAASRHPAALNLVVSNVPGPTEHVTIGGTRLDDLFSVGPILEGTGLNVTAWSYVDRMNFSLLGCPALVEDLASLASRLRPALDELLTMEVDTCQTA
ncbi:MAG TPA: wax ester/triacylglycerol synthase family O-acyltransferase [Nocardioides sp.]|nr:wax ester/triacylglycerol synthase family O-acyltransferase [Nocardioides sp.]